MGSTPFSPVQARASASAISDRGYSYSQGGSAAVILPQRHGGTEKQELRDSVPLALKRHAVRLAFTPVMQRSEMATDK